MQSHLPPSRTRRIVKVVVVGVAAAAVVALIVVDERRTGEPPLRSGLLAAHAAVAAPRTQPAVKAADETWMADESARGVRPDAAH